MISLAVGASQGACTPAPTVDPATFQRPGNQRACQDMNGNAVTETMDTYIVQTFDVAPTFTRARSQDANSSDCETCIGTGQCTIEHPQVCTCSASVIADPDHLTTEMSQTRIPALDTNDVYCFRVLAIDNGTIGDVPTGHCSCDPAWVAPSYVAAHVRLCALSGPAAVGPLGIRLDLRCPGDRSGGQNNSSSPFNDCWNPPSM